VGAGRVFKRQEAGFRYYITVAGPAITSPPSNADPPAKTFGYMFNSTISEPHTSVDL
jgi:hypothetical protein